MDDLLPLVIRTFISNTFVISLVFLFFTLSGRIIFDRLVETKNSALSLSGGLITGLLTYLLLISIICYPFPGGLGIIISLVIYSLVTLYLFKTSKQRVSPNEEREKKFNLAVFINVFATAVYILTIFIYTHKSFVGADAEMYWAIASSFARGNYPTVMSWQPQFLTVYHQGAFILEGALSFLSRVYIEIIHYYFSFAILTALFVFLTGLTYQLTKSSVSFLTAVLVLILIGGPVLPIQFLDFSQILTYLDFHSFQHSNGGGSTNLEGLIYHNFYLLGLATFLLFIYLFISYSKEKISYKYLLLIVLLALNLSIDESFFLPEAVLLGGLFIVKLGTGGAALGIKYVLLGILIFLACFITIQNPLRDSLLTPSAEPRFKALIINPQQKIFWNGTDTGITNLDLIKNRLSFALNKTQGNFVIIGFLPVVILIFLINKIFIKQRIVYLFIVPSLISFMLSFLVINTYWIPNSFRFTNQAYQIAFLALGIIICKLLSQQKKLSKYLGILLLVILLPQIIISHTKFLDKAFRGQRFNFFHQELDLVTKSTVNEVPFGTRIIFLDKYPNETAHSNLNHKAITLYGAFVPYSPKSVKILNPDPGIEWFDAVNTLSPYALKELKIEYVYIQDAALERLSNSRKAQIKNPQFFQFTAFIEDGSLYKVSNEFKELADKENSIKNMVIMIPEGEIVYLDKLKLNEVRKGLILEMANKYKLVGPAHSHGGDFYMYVEASLPFLKFCEGVECLDFNYALMSPQNSPQQFFGQGFSRISGNEYLTLYKSI